MKILTSKQMAEVDRLSTANYGIPSLLLMENAGVNLYLTLEEYFGDDLEDLRAAVLCGPGNNGGDGCVLARQLLQRELSAEIFLLAERDRLKGDARSNFEILDSVGIAIHTISTQDDWLELREHLDSFDIIVDAILGTGISRPLEANSLFGAAVLDVNASDAFILAVDIPSGMRTDALRGGDLTVKADATVTFTAPKVAHILNEDLEALGDLHIVPIGSPSALLEENEEHFLNLITPEMAAAELPLRRINSHKGSFGHAAIIAGSLGKSGAAVLSSKAAIRSGAGLVTTITPSRIQDAVALSIPEIMTEGLLSPESGHFGLNSLEQALRLLEGKDSAALGPGIGTDAQTVEFVHRLVAEANLPMVLDADALNAFANHSEKLRDKETRPLILTPHPGEFARLTGRPMSEVLENRVSLAREFALERQVWLVLKSFRTLVAAPDGQVFACPLGNPGMATAGMGDALTGILAALLGVETTREEAALTQAVVLGVYVHSLSGDMAEEDLGPEALNTMDVIDRLSKAFKQLQNQEP